MQKQVMIGPYALCTSSQFFNDLMVRRTLQNRHTDKKGDALVPFVQHYLLHIKESHTADSTTLDEVSQREIGENLISQTSLSFFLSHIHNVLHNYPFHRSATQTHTDTFSSVLLASRHMSWSEKKRHQGKPKTSSNDDQITPTIENLWIWMSIKMFLSNLQGALIFKCSAQRIRVTFNSPHVRNGAICLSGSTALEESLVLRQNVLETGLSGHFTAFRWMRKRRKCAVKLCSMPFFQSGRLQGAGGHGLMDEREMKITLYLLHMFADDWRSTFQLPSIHRGVRDC